MPPLMRHGDERRMACYDSRRHLKGRTINWAGVRDGQGLCRSSGTAHFGPLSLSVSWREIPRKSGHSRSVGIRLASYRDHPVAPGMIMPVYLELADDGESKYLLIDSAIVRWSNGRDAGWEIRTIDATSRARLIRFLEQVRDELSCQSVEARSR